MRGFDDDSLTLTETFLFARDRSVSKAEIRVLIAFS